MNSRDVKPSTSPNLSDPSRNPSQQPYNYVTPPSLPSLPSNPVTPSTTLLPNAPHLATQPQPIHSLPAPPTRPLYSSQPNSLPRDSMRRQHQTIPTPRPNPRSTESHQSRAQTLQSTQVHPLPTSSQPLPKLDPFSRPISHSVIDSSDPMRPPHLSRPPPLSAPPPQTYDLASAHQHLRPQQHPPFNSSPPPTQLPQLQNALQTAPSTTSALPTEPLTHIPLPQSSQQLNHTIEQPSSSTIQSVPAQPAIPRLKSASNETSQPMNHSSPQQKKNAQGSPNQMSRHQGRPHSQFGQIQQPVDRQRSLQPKQPPPLPPRPAMLAPPRGSVVMQDVPRYQRHVIPSVSSHLTQTSQMIDATSPGTSQQATPASMQPDPMKPHTSNVDHQHHSMYHHGVMPNPRQMPPVPTIAQQMSVSPSVEITSAQRAAQQHSSLPRRLEQSQQPNSGGDQASLPGFPRSVGKHENDFSSTPIADMGSPAHRGGRKSPTGLHRDSGSRFGSGRDGDMYMNPPLRPGGDNVNVAQLGSKEPRVYDAGSMTTSLRNQGSVSTPTTHRTRDALLSAPAPPGSPIQTSQRMNRQQQHDIGGTVSVQSSVQGQPAGELLSQRFPRRPDLANDTRGRTNIDGFVTAPSAAGIGGKRTHLESQSKFGDDEHLAKNNSPHSNRNDAPTVARPSQVSSAPANDFPKSSNDRNIDASSPHRGNPVGNIRESTDTKGFQGSEHKWQHSPEETQKRALSFPANPGALESKNANISTWGSDGTPTAGGKNYPAESEGQAQLYRPISSRLNTRSDAVATINSNSRASPRGSHPTHSTSQMSVEKHPSTNLASDRMDAENETHGDEVEDKHGEDGLVTAEAADVLHDHTGGMTLTDSKKKSGAKEGLAPNRPGGGRLQPTDDNSASQRRPLKVEDALAYLEKVKSQFSDQLSVYNRFLDIMKEFKAECIDTYEVIRRVSTLFGGHKDLILGFNTFLPPGYKIRVHENAKTGVLSTGFQGPAGVFNTLPPHHKVTSSKGAGTRPAGKKKGNLVIGSHEKDAKQLANAPDGQAGPSASSAGTEHPEKDSITAPSMAAARTLTSAAVVKSAPTRRQHGLESNSLQNSRVLQQSVPKIGGTEARAHEFERAIGFVTAIKERFADSPETFNEFLDTLRRFREEQKSIREVFETVADLFGTNKDLLSQFREFIPTIAFGGMQDAKISKDRSVSQVLRRTQGSNVISESTPTRGTIALNGKMKPRHRAREMQFFEDLKAQLGPNKGHLYTEFIKCLSLFSQGIVSKDELLHLTAEILQDDQDAHNSFLDYLDTIANTADSVFDGDHNFSSSVSSEGELTAVDAARMAYYNSKPTSEIAAEAGIEHLYSYRRMPHDFPPFEYSGRSLQEKRTLNDNWINVTTGTEDYSFKFMRRNQNEDNLFRCEDDRYELDLVIETNASTIQKLETIVSTMSKLPLSEKKQHALARGALTPIHFNAIQRIYGDSGAEVVSQLKMNPSVAVPVILKRLKEKDVTWRRARMEMNKVWREVGERNYHRSLDHRSGHFKAVDKKVLSTKSLLMDILDPAASVTARDAEMTRARGYAVENGGAGANHRSQALKAVLAAVQYASDKASRRLLELKFDDLRVHTMVYRLISGVVEDDASKKSIAHFGEMIQSFFKVNFTEDRGTTNDTPDANDDVKILYGDDAVYIVLRLYHLLFERVALAVDLAKEQIADRERRAKLNEEGRKRLARRKKHQGNAKAESLQLSKASDNSDSDGKFSLGPTTESLEEICDQFLDMAKQFAKAKLDWSRYEDKCRTLLGVDSYALFTIDKTVQKLLKAIENMFAQDSPTKGFCDLFHRCQNQLDIARVNAGRLDTEGIEVLYSVTASRYLSEIRGSGANLMRFQSNPGDKEDGTVLIHVIGQTCDEDVTKAISSGRAVLDRFLEFCGSSGDCIAHEAKAREDKDTGLKQVERDSAVKKKGTTGDGNQEKRRQAEKIDFLRYRLRDTEKLFEKLRRGEVLMGNNLEWQLDNDGVMHFATGTCDFLMNVGRKRKWDQGLKREDVNKHCSRSKKMREALKLDADGDEVMRKSVGVGNTGEEDCSGNAGLVEMETEPRKEVGVTPTQAMDMEQKGEDEDVKMADVKDGGEKRDVMSAAARPEALTEEDAGRKTAEPEVRADVDSVGDERK